MAYNNNIPQPGDFISVSQKQFLDNFQSLDQYWNVDHYDLNATDETATKHKKLTMPVQSAAPATLSDEVALYSKTAAGHANLFMRKPNNGAEIQVTNNGGASIPLTLEASVMFDSAGAILGDSVNVASISASSTQYTVSFTAPISTVNYYYAPYGRVNSPLTGTNAVIWIGSKTVNSLTLTISLGNQGLVQTVGLSIWT